MKETQMSICTQYGSPYEPVLPTDAVIIEGNVAHFPIIGCKVTDWNEQGEEHQCWCITCGEPNDHGFDESIERISVAQLLELLPVVMPYLGLSQEYGFIIDEQGVEVFEIENNS